MGRSSVRFAAHADTVLERLAADRRTREAVLLVTSDAAIQGTSGQEVRKRGSIEFLAELAEVSHREAVASRLGERVDAETRARSSGSVAASPTDGHACGESTTALLGCMLAAERREWAWGEHMFLLQWNLRKGVVTLA